MNRPLKRVLTLGCLLSLLCVVAPLAAASATDTAVGSPGSVAVDTSGNVYFSSPNVIYRLTPGGALSIVAGEILPGNPDIVGGFSGDGGAATGAEFNFPLWYFAVGFGYSELPELTGQLALDGTGNLYLADAYNHRVRKIAANGTIATVAGSGNDGYTGDGGAATLADIGIVQGITRDAGGNLYIASEDAHLRKVSASGTISTAATMVCGGDVPNSGDGSISCLPGHIAAVPGGGVVVTDLTFCRVRYVASDGTISTVVGVDPVYDPDSEQYVGVCAASLDTANALEASLDTPYGVAVDATGVVYIADTYDSCVRKFDPGNGVVSTVAGRCGEYNVDRRDLGPGYAGDGGLAILAQMSHPHGVAVDQQGNVYIADTGNSRVRKVDTHGIITTIAGNGWYLPSTP